MRYLLLILMACLVTACTTQANFTPLGSSYAAYSAEHPIEVFQEDEQPAKPYSEIGRLDIHLEATHFITFSLEDALEKMKIEAREAGADGIIEINEKRSRILETSVYHVSATAIRYDSE